MAPATGSHLFRQARQALGLRHLLADEDDAYRRFVEHTEAIMSEEQQIYWQSRADAGRQARKARGRNWKRTGHEVVQNACLGPDRLRVTNRKAMQTLGLILLTAAPAATAANVDVGAMFERAELAGRVGIARKTKLVDGSGCAGPGEVIITVIKGEGKGD